MKEDEKNTSNKNFLDALANALNGIGYAIRTQRNIKIQIVVTAIVIATGIFFQLSTIEFALLIFSCSLVLIAETINTAIEATVNLCTLEYHPIAKIAKDIGAGSVLLASLNAVIIGSILLIEKILTMTI